MWKGPEKGVQVVGLESKQAFLLRLLPVLAILFCQLIPLHIFYQRKNYQCFKSCLDFTSSQSSMVCLWQKEKKDGIRKKRWTERKELNVSFFSFLFKSYFTFHPQFSSWSPASPTAYLPSTLPTGMDLHGTSTKSGTLSWGKIKCPPNPSH